MTHGTGDCRQTERENHFNHEIIMNVTAPMLVCWKQQRRIIDVKEEDNLKKIESLVMDIYSIDQLQDIQVQYYDEIYQTFVDLCTQTMEEFRRVVRKLLRNDAPSKKNQIWRLRIISRDFNTQKYDELESISDQTNISGRISII